MYTYKMIQLDNGTCTPVENLTAVEEVAVSETFFKSFCIKVGHENQLGTFLIESLDELQVHHEDRARAFQWKDSEASLSVPNNKVDAFPIKSVIAEAVDPAHYQGYLLVDGDTQECLQWLEACNRLEKYRNHPEVFCGAVELQIRKYMDRSGKKDNELQEWKKALWYMKYLVAYMANDYNPVLVRNIDGILGSI
ncbi:DUF3310 domain-containing protein [bacterium]|nr:DUF3310 domain-containing protein [bacterium]